MLNRSVINAVAPMVRNLTAANVTVEPIPNTPLGNLVAEQHVPIVDTRAWEASAQPVEEKLNILLDQVELTDRAGTGEHQVCLDAQIKVAADSLRGSILFTRTVVKPQIDEVVGQVNQALKDSDTRIANSMAVTPDMYEPVWDSTSLASLVEPFQDIPKLGQIGDPRVHPQRTSDEVVAMLTTGSSRLDKELKDWVATIGQDQVFSVYQGFFAARPEVGVYDANFNVNDWLDGTGKVYRTNALIIFALAHYMLANVMEDINVPLGAYEQMMTAVIARAGLTINNVMEWRQNCKEAKRLVISWPIAGAEYRTFWSEGGQILVNNDVYLEWLDKGGAPEILMGAAISDRVSDGEFLLENAEKYLEQWRRRAALVRSAQYNERIVVIINTLRDVMTALINSMKDEDQILGDRAPYHQKLDQALSHCRHEDPDHIYQIVRRVVCKTLYDYRDCLQILETIDAVAAREPDLEIDEVATLAVVDIVVAWLVKQVIVRG